MTLRVTCPSCQETFNVTDNQRGKKMTCWACGKDMVVPGGALTPNVAPMPQAPRISSPSSEAHSAPRKARPSATLSTSPPTPVPQGEGRMTLSDPHPTASGTLPQPSLQSSDAGIPKSAPAPAPMPHYSSDFSDAPPAGGVSPVGVWAACLVALLLVGGGAVFFLTKKNNPMGTDKVVVPQLPLAANTEQPKPNTAPITPIEPVKLEPQIPKEEPKKIELAQVKPDPLVKQPFETEPASFGGAMKGEKIYERLLQSTVWIVAAQSQSVAAAPAPMKPAPQPGVPMTPPGQALVPVKPAGVPGANPMPPVQTPMPIKPGLGGGNPMGPGSPPGIPPFPGGQGLPPFPGGQNPLPPADTPMGQQGLPPFPGGGKPDLPPFPGGNTPEKPATKKVNDAYGSGTLIDKKHRLVVTNMHVVVAASGIKIHFPELDAKGIPIPQRDHYKAQAGIAGKVVAVEPRADLALVQLEKLPAHVRPLPLAKGKTTPAQQVHSLGNPGVSAALWSYTPGRVRQVFQDKWRVFDDIGGKFHEYDALKIETDSALNPGDSGGPLVNDRCSLAGVAHGGNLAAQNMSVFIDVSEVRALVEKHFRSLNDTFVPEPEAVTSEVNLSDLTQWIKKLGNEDFAVRVQAAKVLGSMADDATIAFSPLLAALKDKEVVVRRAVSDALERVPPHKDDLALLIKTSRETTEPMEVRVQAAKSIGRLGTTARSAVPTLLEMARRGADDLRLAALASLVAVGPEARDVPALAKLLRDATDDERRLLLEAIGRMGADGQKAVPEVAALLKTGDRNARLQALRALEALGPSAKNAATAIHDALKDADQDIGLQASRALVRLGEGKTAVGFLAGAIKNGSVNQRLEAVRVLSDLGTDAKSAAPQLATALEDDALRPHAAEALLKIGGPGVPAVCAKLTALIKTGASPKARLACIQCLDQIGLASKESVNALSAAYHFDTVPDNRQAALAAWKKLSGSQ
ncbi:MAG: HEAT repeat domain-containing protein [Gemmataceae bacterium]|nr:HEAT repeat domain-containing protein [Gemmataceae bacterium]